MHVDLKAFVKDYPKIYHSKASSLIRIKFCL